MNTYGLPQTDLAREALEHVRSVEHRAILHHSLRVFHIASHLSTLEAEAHLVSDDEALFYACLFHDIGTAQLYNGAQRFEVEGADAAAAFLAKAGWGHERIEPVWQAIALHTSAGIAERFPAVVRLTRAAVLVDFGRTGALEHAPTELLDLLSAFERLDVERVLGRAVVAQALSSENQGRKAPRATWPGSLLAGHLSDPDHEGVNPGF